MSLWKVSDKETQELMSSFYQHWLEKKQSIPEAFRSAQAEIRASHPNPFYWAGFILIE
jgi:CHAT domain-containing protein